MKKEILIACFFVVMLLFVPFTAISGGAINIKSKVKGTSKITNEKTDSVEQTPNEIETENTFLIQNLPEGRGMQIFKIAISFYWLDCIFIFVLREIAWMRFSDSPPNSEEAEFWYGIYQFLDEKFTEKCKDSNLSDSNTDSIGCGCIEKYI